MTKKQTPPYQGPPYVHGRVLNRHKRGRPRYGVFKRLKSRAMRLVPLFLIGALVAAVLSFAKFLGLL